jgi:RNA polymerase sigma-70 factor, ECF subfamily
MTQTPETATRAVTIKIPEPLAVQLHREAGAEKFGLATQDFASILQAVATKYLPSSADLAQITEFTTHLRLEELALARACVAGNEKAWEVFLTRYREKLFTAAHSIVKGDANARELADSLYADLYGTKTADGKRASKLSSYTGRGSLEGWLRAVLAQEYVNRFRREQRLVSLDEQTEAGVQFAGENPDPAQAVDSRLVDATDKALASLAPEDKFILANYYLDDRTLAETARLLGVHESTVSRKVEKITAATRKAILNGLIKRGMSKKEAAQTMEVEVEQLTLDVRKRLMQEKGSESVPQ